jgi:hypothetical protein
MQVLSVSWVVHRIKLGLLGPLKVACLELQDQMTASSRRDIIEMGPTTKNNLDRFLATLLLTAPETQDMRGFERDNNARHFLKTSRTARQHHTETSRALQARISAPEKTLKAM